MKKVYYVISLLLCTVCAFWSCDEFPGTSGSGSGSSPKDSISGGTNTEKVELLPPLEAKQKMESVGLNFVNAIKADDHDNIITAMEYLVNTLGDFDLSEEYCEKLEAMAKHQHEEEAVEEVSVAHRRNPVVAMTNMTMSCVGAAKKGAQLSTRAASICNWVYTLNLPDVYGGLTPDFENEEWTYDDSINDRVEVSFTDDNNQKWVATLKGSEKTTRIHLAYYDESTYNTEYEGGEKDGTSESYTDIYSSEYTIDVPETIEFIVTCDGKVVVELNVSSSLAIDMNVEEESTNNEQYSWYEWCDSWWDEWYEEWYDEEADEWIGEWKGEWKEEWYGYYEWNDYNYESKYRLDISYNNLNLAAELKVNGYEESIKTEVTKSGATMSTELKINSMSMLKASGRVNANADALIADAEKEEFKAKNITDFYMNVDILGELQIAAECKNFKNMYDAFTLYDEAQDAGNKNLFYNRIKELNSTYKINVSFDGNTKTQAYVELEGFEDEDEWDGSIYLGITPVIVFVADDSRYAMEDYFTETAFSDLIEAVEMLGEEFEDLYGEFFEAESEVVVPDYGYDDVYGK